MKILTAEQKLEYKKLQRKVGEAYDKCFDQGTGGQKTGVGVNLFNNRLERMKDFCKENGLNNCRFMRMESLSPKLNKP
jgi:hypothetical protein